MYIKYRRNGHMFIQKVVDVIQNGNAKQYVTAYHKVDYNDVIDSFYVPSMTVKKFKRFYH